MTRLALSLLLLLSVVPAAAAAPSLRISDASAHEARPAVFTVKLSRRVAKRVTVRFRTVQGTALAGVDFAARTGRLVFRPGQRVKRIAVRTAADAADEVDETFVIRLARAVNARIRDRAGTGTIVDDYSPSPPPPPPPPAPPTAGDLVLNEIHADPHLTEGDANGDGTVSSDGDEFVELVNVSGHALALGGVTVSDALTVRYTFPDDVVLQPRCAAVVFGGLVLNNGGDTVTIARGDTPLTSVTYGPEGGQDQALTRSPELTGTFVGHLTANPAARFSPSRRVDGTPFC
jgi:Lamin Tail Domain/Calx-beta domain